MYVALMQRALDSMEDSFVRDRRATQQMSTQHQVATSMRSRVRGIAWPLVAWLAVTGCSSQSPVEAPTEAPRLASLDAAALAGSWHVVATNFPMWLSGDKQDPMFTYTPRIEDGTLRLDDVVSYRAAGKRQTIVGVDTQDAVVRSQFVWRGRGWLRLFSSTWAVAGGAPEQGWLILFFTPTLATPAGVDIISRTPTLAPDAKAQALRVIAESPFLRERAQGLTWLPTPRPDIP